jgi:hypothetical protein
MITSEKKFSRDTIEQQKFFLKLSLQEKFHEKYFSKNFLKHVDLYFIKIIFGTKKNFKEKIFYHQGLMYV